MSFYYQAISTFPNDFKISFDFEKGLEFLKLGYIFKFLVTERGDGCDEIKK